MTSPGIPEQFQWLADLTRDYGGRLSRYERQLERLYGSDVWEQLADIRVHRPNLPPWCWLPIEDALTVVERHQTPLFHGAVLAAMATWRRCGRPVFLPHETFIPTPDPTLPVKAAFDRLVSELPELCCYVATPTKSGMEGATGYFVHLEWDADLNTAEIRFLLAHQPGTHLGALLVQPVRVLSDATLTSALDETWRMAGARMELLFNMPGAAADAGRRRELVERQAHHLGYLLAMALALGSSDVVALSAAEVMIGTNQPRRYLRHQGEPETPLHLELVAPRSMAS